MKKTTEKSNEITTKQRISFSAGPAIKVAPKKLRTGLKAGPLIQVGTDPG